MNLKTNNWKYWYFWFKNREWHWNYKFFVASIISLLLIIDIWTKKIAVDYLQDNRQVINFLPGFIQIQLTYNTGTAFGFGADNPQLIITSHILLTIILVVGLIFSKNLVIHIGLGFILAGAFGNLIGRFSEKGVVDFLLWELFQPYSIFNLADVYITFGTIICTIQLVIGLIQNE